MSLRGIVVSYTPKTNPDGSITWIAIVLAENGQMGEVDAVDVQTWVKTPSEAALGAATPEFEAGDKIQVRSSGLTGVIILVENGVYTVVFPDGATVKMAGDELQLIH